MLFILLVSLWRGKRVSGVATITKPEPEQRRTMTWAKRLKRVFRIDVEVCEQCGGAMKIIACIERPDFIERILSHLPCSRGHVQGVTHKSIAVNRAIKL